MNDYFLFITVTFIAALSPGPAVILVIKNGANYGFKLALLGILGNISAVLIWSSISITGIGFLLQSSNDFIFLLKIVGGFYLLFLGNQSLKSMPSDLDNFEIDKNNNAKTTRSLVKLYFEALLVGMGNPKAILFFAALFPQFIDEQGVELFDIVILTLGCCFCSGICLMIYAFSAANCREVLARNKKIAVWLNYLIGGVFIVFGAVLLLST